MRRYPSLLPIAVLLLITSASVAFLVYQQVFTDHYMSDTQPHIIFLYKYFYDPSSYYIPHPLWHYGTFIFSKVLHVSVYVSAIIFSTLLVTINMMIVYIIVRNLLPALSPLLSTIVTFSITIIGPLCIPWIDKIIYLGAGSPNTWHNVTLWAVKPFAILTLLFSILALQTHKMKYGMLSIVMLILSLYAKPSFAIMFLPTFFLFVITQSKYRSKRSLLFAALLSGVSAIILYYQFTHTFVAGDSKVIFDLFGVWSRSTQNIPYSIVMGLAFPMLLLLSKPEIIHDDYLLIGWLQVLIGIILYACFAETGKYYNHGNFAWSYMIAMSILYLFSIIKFLDIYRRLHAIKRYMLSGLLGIQTIIGIYYYIHVLMGQNPLYIGIFI